METRILWDETKRQANLRKHGLDFLDAVMVLGSALRIVSFRTASQEERSAYHGWLESDYDNP